MGNVFSALHILTRNDEFDLYFMVDWTKLFNLLSTCYKCYQCCTLKCRICNWWQCSHALHHSFGMIFYNPRVTGKFKTGNEFKKNMLALSIFIQNFPKIILQCPRSNDEYQSTSVKYIVEQSIMPYTCILHFNVYFSTEISTVLHVYVETDNVHFVLQRPNC